VGVNMRGTAARAALTTSSNRLLLDGYDIIETVATQMGGQVGWSHPFPGIASSSSRTQPPHLVAITPLAVSASTPR
jgi:hypothetical protein